MFKGNRILVMERWRRDEATGEISHYFSIPGGGIEEGETPEEAAVREIWEEMRVDAELGPMVATTSTPRGKRYYFLGYYKSGTALLHPKSPEAQQNDPGNRFKPRWLPVGELNEGNCHPDYQRLIPLIRDMHAGNIPLKP